MTWFPWVYFYFVQLTLIVSPKPSNALFSQATSQRRKQSEELPRRRKVDEKEVKYKSKERDGDEEEDEEEDLHDDEVEGEENEHLSGEDSSEEEG